MKKTLLFAALLLAAIDTYAQSFSDYFTDQTLRVDYIFSGNVSQQMVALDELSSFDGWAGRRVNLDKVPVRGNGEISIIEPESGKAIYRQTFSSLFQEWLVTDEATRLTKSFEATFLLPMPTKEVEIEITLLDNEGHL
ncbi:MAG: peptidase M64, partial [Alistipes sp.]|nr:peptidase M64 [Alistipes sp.]